MTEPEPSSWQVRLAAVAVPMFAVGWFFLEWLAMGESVPDAIGEALGAGLGLLVALSVVGAALTARQRRRTQP
jgi:hypothetical protein